MRSQQGVLVRPEDVAAQTDVEAQRCALTPKRNELPGVIRPERLPNVRRRVPLICKVKDLLHCGLAGLRPVSTAPLPVVVRLFARIR
ncbi:hypothetical protein MTO96_000669 [Rhipicephalus appendiculatus]